jgi:cytoskeletal protein CcmA (bactofilin family)
MTNLDVNGVTTCNGGIYDDVKIKGVIQVDGDITCKKADIEGVYRMQGHLTSSGRLSISGTCHIAGSVKTEDCRVYGVLDLEGDLQSETVTADGMLAVKGTVNADTIALKMARGSGAKEVFGHSLRVTSKGISSVFFGILNAKKHEFTADTIECDDIYLEYSNVGSVSGAKVVLGPKCHVKRLEYSEEYSADKTAVVDEVVKRA